MPQDQPKIAMVNNTLSKGGAEQVQARLSFFFEANGIEVHHILVKDEITYPFAGTLFNMGLLKNKSNGPFNKMKRLRALNRYLKEHQFDSIIDFRVKNNYIQEYLIANWVYKTKYVMTIRSFNTSYYFPDDVQKAKTIYRKAHGIIAVSKALKDKIVSQYGYQNVQTIYNPLDISELKKMAKMDIKAPASYILGVGRMQANVKQFDHLIKAYHESSAFQKGMDLVLVGEGEDRKGYEELVAKLDIVSRVHFIGFTDNPHPYFKNAYVTVLTSKYEGFPNVLIESLVQGTPVISYDCESGPSEIIEHETNGLLVKNQDQPALKAAIDSMVLDKKLYQHCKSSAGKSVARFEMDIIGRQWLDFLKLNQKD